VAAELKKEGGAAVILVTAPIRKRSARWSMGSGCAADCYRRGSAEPFGISSFQLIGAQRTIIGWPRERHATPKTP